MTYQSRIEEMVGKHIAGFQQELTTAKHASGLLKYGSSMPYGYPPAVYHPMHFCKTPVVRQFIAKTGGLISNGVPRALRTQMIGNYILGTYNHGVCLACR